VIEADPVDAVIDELSAAIEDLKSAHADVVRELKAENEELGRRLALLEANR